MNDLEIIQNTLKMLEPIKTSIEQGMDDAFKVLTTLLVTLNGGGLIASLAFIGAIISNSSFHSSFTLLLISAFIFGLGTISSLLLAVCNYFYFKSKVKKYSSLFDDAEKLKYRLLNPNEIITDLSQETKMQKKLIWGINIFLILAGAFFLLAFATGFTQIFKML